MNKTRPWEGETWYASDEEFAYTMLSVMSGLLTDHQLPDATGSEDDHDFLRKWATHCEIALEHVAQNILLTILKSAMKVFEKKGKKSGAEFHSEYQAILTLVTHQIQFHIVIPISDRSKNLDIWPAPSLGPSSPRMSIVCPCTSRSTSSTLCWRGTLPTVYISKTSTPSTTKIIRIGSSATGSTKSTLCRRAVTNTTFHNLDPALPSSFSAATFLSFNMRLSLGRGYMINKWIAGTGIHKY